MATYLVQYTIHPEPRTTYEVSEAEYERGIELGIIVNAPAAPQPPDVFDDEVAALVPDPATATGAALRAAFGRAAPVLSDFVYDATTGDLLSYAEDGIPIVLTYNPDGTVATSKRGTEPAQTFSYSGGNLVGVA